MLRSLFIVGGLAGAFGMGYLLQGSRDSSKTNAVQVTANRQSAAPSAAENAEPAGDPSLKLPDRLPDADGVTFDASFQAIKGHYKELAKPLIPAADKSLPLPPLVPIPDWPQEPKKLPEEVSGPMLPPVPARNADNKVEGPPKKADMKLVQIEANDPPIPPFAVDRGKTEPFAAEPAITTTKPASPPMSARTAVRFADPEGMKVSWYGPHGWNDIPLTTKACYNFLQGGIYRLKLSQIPNKPDDPHVARRTSDGKEIVRPDLGPLFPTLEVMPTTPKIATFLAHCSVSVSFSNADLQQVSAGTFLVKVIYLPNPENKDSDLVGTPEELASTRLKPGMDPITEAKKRGEVLLIVRMGNINLENPTSPPMEAGLSEAEVERKMTIVTDPPGSKVTINGKEIGFSPLNFSLIYYGKYHIKLQKDGYQTRVIEERIAAPIDENPPLNILAKNIFIHDKHLLKYTLDPLPLARPCVIGQSINALPHPLEREPTVPVQAARIVSGDDGQRYVVQGGVAFPIAGSQSGTMAIPCAISQSPDAGPRNGRAHWPTEQLPMPREASAIPELAPMPREIDYKAIFSFWLGFFQ